MIKTKSHFENFIVNGDRPKNQGLPIVVRAPKHLRCFRATIIVSNYGQIGTGNDGLFISTFPTNQEQQCVYMSSVETTDLQVAPATQFSISSPNTLILDRRGVGYMDDELYFYSVDAYVTVIWEGEIYE
jgi:hypothetical protein